MQNGTCFSKENVYLVFGIGSTGRASIAFCKRHYLRFFITCDNREELKKLTKIEDINIKESDKIYDYHDLDALKESGITTIILSPSVHAQNEPHEIVKIAEKNKIDIVSDVDLFYCYLRDYNKKHRVDKQMIAITGTNGKSTTTALTAHILNSYGRRAIACGNIGLNCLLLDVEKYDFFVIEMSSYNLYLTHYAQFNCGVLLNITEDHLEYHGSMENYVNAKAKALLNSRSAFICVDDKWTKDIFLKVKNGLREYVSDRRGRAINNNIKQMPEKCICVSKLNVLEDGLSRKDNVFYKNGKKLTKINFVNLPGSHNIENILCSMSVALNYKIAFTDICDSIKRFTSLRHRLQLVKTVNGVDFINDSKGTNADSTQKALQAYKDKDIYLIAGGKRKTAGFFALENDLDNVRYVFLVGEASDSFADELNSINDRRKKQHKTEISYQKCKTIDGAVKMSFEVVENDLLKTKNTRKIKETRQTKMETNIEKERAKKSKKTKAENRKPIVLLSPLCASFDQYKSFEERGDDFCACVEKLSQ